MKLTGLKKLIFEKIVHQIFGMRRGDMIIVYAYALKDGE